MSAPNNRCHYEVLGLHPHAQKQEIKNAYKRMALRFHPDKNRGDPSAKVLFQEIQAAYETLSEDKRRAKYDATAGFAPSNSPTRAWREPTYEPYNAYARDPPFWSVELREMTVQKCARIAKIQDLESQIRELVVNLNDMVDAEDRAVRKKEKAECWFSLIKSRPPKVNAQRHRDFLTKSACFNTHLDRLKNELRMAHDDDKKKLEIDNARKTWWARERVRRVEEANRRATTTAAEAARRRAEKARQDRERDSEAVRAAEEIRRQAREETIRIAREAKAEEESRKRAERTREDPEAARRAVREAQEWLIRKREETLEPKAREGMGEREDVSR